MRWWPLAIALLVACGQASAPPEQEPKKVPARWRAVRESRGHVVHLDGKAACRDCHPNDSYGPVDPDRCAKCHGGRSELHVERSKTSTSTPVCVDCHAFGDTRKDPWACRDCHALKAEARIHGKEDCSACHKPHAAKAEPRACTSCHEEKSASHGRKRDPAQCRDCHAGHQPAAAIKKDCGRCHDKGPPVAKLPEGHAACLDCHKPHGGEDGARVECVRCHAKVVLAHGRGPAGCIDCHQPHAQATSSNTFARVRDCKDCHAEVRPHNDGLKCLDCHDQHATHMIPSTALCQRCHQEPRPEGHQACSQCHLRAGHQTKQTQGECNRCHQNIVHQASPGHADCKQCHDAHGRVEKPDCARCHVREAGTAHVTALAASMAPAASGSGQAVCARCHDRHDTTPKLSCGSCHKQSELFGLHQSPKHGKCESCHGVHQASAPDARASCTSCHLNRGDHEPNAQRCAGCHPFKAP